MYFQYLSVFNYIICPSIWNRYFIAYGPQIISRLSSFRHTTAIFIATHLEVVNHLKTVGIFYLDLNPIPGPAAPVERTAARTHARTLVVVDFYLYMFLPLSFFQVISVLECLWCLPGCQLTDLYTFLIFIYIFHAAIRNKIPLRLSYLLRQHIYYLHHAYIGLVTPDGIRFCRSHMWQTYQLWQLTPWGFNIPYLNLKVSADVSPRRLRRILEGPHPSTISARRCLTLCAENVSLSCSH